METAEVYSERVNRYGYKIGEDALPFANTAGMFVADGMGGSAGIRVSKLDPRCFDPEWLSKKLCEYYLMEEKFGPDTASVFADYIKRSFASLLTPDMEEIYRQAAPRYELLKKSGYIGSHALGCVLAGILISLEQNLLTLSREEWEDILTDSENFLWIMATEVIDILGAQCAQTTMNKIDYYGTTLSAAFYRETEEEIHVCFLNCGDSRSYVWDADGLRQAAEDQGRNGSVTERFSLNGPPPHVSCEWKTYRKPCVLFCMTDGVYSTFSGKEGFPSSPLYMEGFLLNTFAQTGTLKQAAEQMTDTFDRYGKVDDSNSLVIAAFGFDPEHTLQAAARERLDALERQYSLGSKPEDFLVVDYGPKTTQGPFRQRKLYQKLQKAQKAVFEDYIQKHLAEVSQSKRDDVARNGWL